MIEDLKKVQSASRGLVEEEKVNQVLKSLAQALRAERQTILEENQKDLEQMDSNDPKYDRLLLTGERLEAIAGDIENVAALPSPLGRVLDERTLPSGLELKRVTVPIGVIGIIYEARPNVTYDVFSLCFKSGNACVLKGGSDAHYSNVASVGLIQKVLEEHGIDKNVIYLAPKDREVVAEILQADEYIDMVIPRGSQKLISFVRENAKVPVIETGAGIVHTYFDESADLSMGKAIIENAKTRRPSVCNALDTLVVHKDRLKDLAELVKPLEKHEVQILADDQAYAVLEGKYGFLNKALEEHFGTEFLSLKMSVKTVDNIDKAIEHISQYSSKHSEAIISNDEQNIDKFFNQVDAAVVYSNTSTAFTDGAQFGIGAEIGISTQKLHARGPMALNELTTYKWVIRGHGETRPV